MHSVRFTIFFSAIALLAVSSCSRGAPEVAPAVYVTEYGLGPDKWATAWLLTKRPGVVAKLLVVDAGAAVVGGTPFDVPVSAWRRIGERSGFEVARDALQLSDPVIATLARIVHEIEVNFWTSDGPPEALIVEEAYRALQHRYGRESVTPQCYVAFFDRVYEVLRDVQARSIYLDADRLNLSCEELVQVASTRGEIVPEAPIADVLSAMAAGRRVVFVDVREPDEFAEGHIPGALNIPLREATPEFAERLRGADYVVSYCVKDFRGFEMARALADMGVANSVILRPYGIKGWASLGLPITGARALTHDDAQRDLAECLAAQGECLTRRAAALESPT
ncbi:MAG: rhodanese-like domain-containing protein [Steroidobacter sp.]